MTEVIDPTKLLQTRRKIMGISAILLPYHVGGEVDWQGFDEHLHRTLDAGLIPAVNMDTGYGNLIDDAVREEVLLRAQRIAGGRAFIAGVFVGDHPGSPFGRDLYRVGIEQIQRHGGTPIFFQSYGLIELPDDELVEAHHTLARECEEFLFFELGQIFAPFGRIYSLDVYQQLMMIPNALGAKHSSLHRLPEWQRLELRNRVRPDFRVFTGNDLAIDMVMYGSDYLLGLSTFAPDAFARRDAMWEAGDPSFHELNDLLQYLGTFAFRDPTPAYKHSAAMFLKIRGMLVSEQTHPDSLRRPDSDVTVLELIASDIQRIMKEDN
ncbi:MAG: dihydrodipicolinate synthase family protein [Planctomycetaceae bacterium TMED240]|nr:dihydrodipicolinate synthase family protein [Rhodopirellula sp.]OUX07419.1 MAG: dihydrodipicolinate synthase family protein [Planctomycetaceae bacterium TMED240]